jgi:hypothetical protein
MIFFDRRSTAREIAGKMGSGRWISIYVLKKGKNRCHCERSLRSAQGKLRERSPGPATAEPGQGNLPLRKKGGIASSLRSPRFAFKTAHGARASSFSPRGQARNDISAFFNNLLREPAYGI